MFFFKSSNFCKKGCGNTDADILAGNTARLRLLIAVSKDTREPWPCP